MFLAKNFPEAILESTPSTAYATNTLQNIQNYLCAIAPKLSAEMYDLTIEKIYKIYR